MNAVGELLTLALLPGVRPRDVRPLLARAPLRDSRWPPDLQRTVRRWMQRGKAMERPEQTQSGRSSWDPRS